MANGKKANNKSIDNNETNDSFQTILDVSISNVQKKIQDEQEKQRNIKWAQKLEEHFSNQDVPASFKDFYIYRRENSLGDIDELIEFLEYCEKYYNYPISKIIDRETIVNFTLEHLKDPKNEIIIMKGGDWDIFSGKEPNRDKFIEGYKTCAKNCEEIIVMVDPRFKKGGIPQVEKNIKILQECLEGSNYKLVYEGSPIRCTLFIKKDGSCYLSLWYSKVHGERTEGFPHRPEISIYQGVILSSEKDIDKYFFQDISISLEQVSGPTTLLKRSKVRPDILVSEDIITLLSYQEYLRRLAEIAKASY